MLREGWAQAQANTQSQPHDALPKGGMEDDLPHVSERQNGYLRTMGVGVSLSEACRWLSLRREKEEDHKEDHDHLPHAESTESHPDVIHPGTMPMGRLRCNPTGYSTTTDPALMARTPPGGYGD